MATFTARVAPSFTRDDVDCLYEVTTQEGERIASTTSEYHAQTLANRLNSEIAMWADRVGVDAVVNTEG